MPGLREVRTALLLAHHDNLIEDEELLLLYDLNRSKNPDFPYWRYPAFDLDRLNEDECIANFRFGKNDIYQLKELFQIPENIFCYNGTKVDAIEALYFFETVCISNKIW